MTLIIHCRLNEVEMSFSDFALTNMTLVHIFPMMTRFILIVVIFPFFILLTDAFRMRRFAFSMMVVEMPLGKWTHMKYRPFALYFQSLKKKTMEQSQQPLGEVPDYVP